MTAKKEAVQAYIDRVLAPKIQGDGGWVEFVSLEGDRLTLRFRGECSKCLILHRCVAWIEEQLATDLHLQLTVEAGAEETLFSGSLRRCRYGTY